jgi:hypothetical protein
VGPGGVKAAPAVAALLAAAAAATPVERLESRWADLAELHGQITVTKARGSARSLSGASLPELEARYRVVRREIVARLPALPAPRAPEDARALAAMRHALDDSFVESVEDEAAPTTKPPACEYDPVALGGGPGGLEALRSRIYACYGGVAQALSVDGETLDRLTILARLGETDDAQARRRLFLALDPLWRTVNAGGGAESPYRELIALTTASKSRAAPLETRGRELGMDPATLEKGLVSILEAWRDAVPPGPLEPWDYWHANEAASRALSPRVPKDALRGLSDAFYRSLGADPSSLGIHFDLDPRPGKTPVAFTDFGAPARQRGAAWSTGEFWVFATYRAGGLGNLVELLHETGHGIHIAAIRARPAFASWPDSDPFTEALADVPALEAYEPDWQRRYLGSAAGIQDSLRSKYGSIVLDVAWALFEVRMHREPGSDPNQVWTALTRDYLRIVPHPELSWWAMRGQLVSSPGYMTNYAIGAILAADMRDRCRSRRGPFWAGDPGYYAWLSEGLYRFGLERTSREVLAAFLGRPPSPAALLEDLGRMRRGS